MPSFFLNKYVIYAISVLIIGLFSTGAYFIWKHQVEQAVLAEFNRAQLEKVVKDQKESLELMKTLSVTQDRIIVEMQARNAELTAKIGGIEDYLVSPDAVKDNRESSEVLKKTIERLGK